jgi:hypothetical protein
VSVPAKLSAFALLLAAAFGVGAAVGAAAGPIEVGDPVPHEISDDPGASHDGGH